MQLPAGARLKFLTGLSRDEMIGLYQKAKVLVDSYITGCEREVFEAALFDVVPLVATHGNARNPQDFPLPGSWRWPIFDYQRLSQLVSAALRDHAAAVADMAPLRQFVTQMPAVFSEQVKRYFQVSWEMCEEDTENFHLTSHVFAG